MMFNSAAILILSSFMVLAFGSNFWNQPLERYETQTCSSNNGTEFCLSCGTIVICLLQGDDYQEIHGTCPVESPCVGGACSSVGYQNCSCAGNSGINYLCDPYNPQYYILCVNEDVNFLACPDGQEFDCLVSDVCAVPPTTTTTSTTTTTPPPPCNETGIFPSECTGFLVCTTVGQPPAQYPCANGTFFDPNEGDCVPQEPFYCNATSVTGSYRDPYDCQRYYVCAEDVLVLAECCADGYYYDDTLGVSSCQPNKNEECVNSIECSPTITGSRSKIYREFHQWKNYDLRSYFSH